MGSRPSRASPALSPASHPKAQHAVARRGKRAYPPLPTPPAVVSVGDGRIRPIIDKHGREVIVQLPPSGAKIQGDRWPTVTSNNDRVYFVAKQSQPVDRSAAAQPSSLDAVLLSRRRSSLAPREPGGEEAAAEASATRSSKRASMVSAASASAASAPRPPSGSRKASAVVLAAAADV